MVRFDGIQIKIINWDKYQDRKDVKNPSWFRLNHGLYTAWQFYDFDHSEVAFWIYLLCEASSRNQGGLITVNIEHAHRVGKFAVTTINSTIKKLKTNQVIEVRTVRGRYVNVNDPGTTRQDRTEQDRTEQDRTEQDNTSLAGARLVYPKEFEELWNQYQEGKKPRGDKKKSLLEYKKLKVSPSELEILKKAIAGYLKSNPDEKYRLHFQRFLASDYRVHAEVAQPAPRFVFTDSTEVVGA